MRRLWVLALLALLPGCLPPALTVVSFAADGASFAATRKTVGDHGISIVTARDCAIIGRLFDGQPVCIDRAPDASIPLEDRRQPRLLLVVGSYSNPSNAEREAQRFAAYGATIVPSMVNGHLLHRVVVGPVSVAEAAALGPDTWNAPR